ncbi:MAG: NAD(P)-binding domain-containing protein [Kofleriaceae bacterium]|nr:NAD(P)-binding domain-containing protein [Kofleriaceae bacterium]MBP6841477.1 NAD(P)-binding domain-containing protein [Kofleriaceae bacterium]MBP9203603.1 NAD(P)-binding domain-containing protein [Kofleriaceae bacterium]
MTWIVPLALVGLAILVMAVFTTLAGRKQARSEVQPAAMAGGPRILVHDINDDRCTGCDACVAVCPTNVLDLVENKSRVLRFQDCIQCEACMHACPTEALVMFPEGAEPPPLKVPEMDGHFQTAIPGQYLIGEVAGKPLVKNAANLGRMVVEHMLATGLRPGSRHDPTSVDVAIVGSGPGGLSAALSCAQRGLSYVLLEKEQILATTIARYPKGKLVMAEPYDTDNVSLLPVFDSSKEELIPIWRELVDRVGVRINMGESVEAVAPNQAGGFEVRTTVAAYRAQRVVLAIGTRGKPRTLQVPGENLPKVANLLEDPDELRGRAVLVVGGGDSAVEAAVAIADAGGRVMLSYRGRSFNRCAQKNKQTVENYAKEGRLKVKLQSQVVAIEPEAVILQLGDGTQKRYGNDAVFVLIGADPPVAWLEKLGVRFVQRPHQYQLGKSDDLVRQFLPHATACPEDAARAAAGVLGGSTGVDRAVAAVGLPPAPGESVSAPRRWLRAATNMLGTSGAKTGGPKTAGPRTAGPSAAAPRTNASAAKPPPVRKDERPRDKKLAAPVPLSEFARGKSQHTGHGRRDALSPSERTRVLRMLRDEGGRLADEDSRVFIGAAPNADFDFDLDDDVVAAPPPSPRPVGDAKPAVIVGLAQAQARGPANRRTKRSSEMPVAEPEPPARSARPSAAPPLPGRGQPAPTRPPAPPLPSAGRGKPSAPPPATTGPRRAPPPPFSEEPTRQVADDVLRSLRDDDPGVRASGRPGLPGMGGGKAPARSPFDEEATRHAPMDPRLIGLLDGPVDGGVLDSAETGTARTAPDDLDRILDEELGDVVEAPSSRGGSVRVTGSIDLGPVTKPANLTTPSKPSPPGAATRARAGATSRKAAGPTRPPASGERQGGERQGGERGGAGADRPLGDVDWDLD